MKIKIGLYIMPVSCLACIHLKIPATQSIYCKEHFQLTNFDHAHYCDSYETRNKLKKL